MEYDNQHDSQLDLKNIEHPLENVLNLEEGSTQVPTVDSESESTELTISEHYDDKDAEIETQFQEIYKNALDAFKQQQEENQIIEPKYRARNQEVSVQFLNTALSAAREKAQLKQHKDKRNDSKSKSNGTTVNQQFVVADRNELLKELNPVDEQTGESSGEN